MQYEIWKGSLLLQRLYQTWYEELPWFVPQKVPWQNNWFITTTITITIAHNYVITSVLYVFYCHRSCLLLLLSLRFFVIFSSCICAHIGGGRSLKKRYGTIAVKALLYFSLKLAHVRFIPSLKAMLSLWAKFAPATV